MTYRDAAGRPRVTIQPLTTGMMLSGVTVLESEADFVAYLKAICDGWLETRALAPDKGGRHGPHPHPLPGRKARP